MPQPTYADGRTRQEQLNDYDSFVDKFKRKKTTDDCFTPAPIYDAVLDYLHSVGAIPLDAPIVRPFWPGADYTKADYPQGSIVVDNPPFSILSEIVHYYISRRQPFFLFAPSLTLTQYARIPGLTLICTAAPIIYANGANVPTSFLSYGIPHFQPHLLLTLPPLLAALESAIARRPRPAPKPAYAYPTAVTSAALISRLSRVPITIAPHEARFIYRLDSQRPQKKSIFGGGLLLSSSAAARIAAAREAAAREAAAIPWPLSSREEALIQEMDDYNE